MKNRFDLHVHARKFGVCVDMRVRSRASRGNDAHARLRMHARFSFVAYGAMQISARVFGINQTGE